MLIYQKLITLAKDHNAFTIVDDAHATGALGPYGKGTKQHFKLAAGIDMVTGSLSKSLPGIGGFVACNKTIAQLLRFGSNGYVFSASLPPPILAGLIMAINILENEPERQDRLQQNTHHIRNALNTIGLNTMNSTTSIIPILLHSKKMTLKFADELHKKGVFVNPICYPAVPNRLSRLRINASAALEPNDIDSALTIIENTAKKLELI